VCSTFERGDARGKLAGFFWEILVFVSMELDFEGKRTGQDPLYD
jgi:hypothetical protein